MKKIHKYEEFINENTSVDQSELDKIQMWLSDTTEEFDDWNWDGSELHLFMNDECVEKYTKKDLEEENII